MTEPTSLRVCVAHKGFVWAEIETRGRAAHGSRTAEGVDAITRMAPVLTRLAELQSGLDAAPRHELVGPGSVHASLIEGGQELSSYPARCLLSLERRTVPGETAEDVRRECEALVEGVDGAEARLGLVREPFSVDPGAEVVGAVSRAAEAVTGGTPCPTARPTGWTRRSSRPPASPRWSSGRAARGPTRSRSGWTSRASRPAPMGSSCRSSALQLIEIRSRGNVRIVAF